MQLTRKGARGILQWFSRCDILQIYGSNILQGSQEMQTVCQALTRLRYGMCNNHQCKA
jgi:hypothetical protein